MRGEDFSSTISDDHMQAFRDYLHKADEDVRKSIALNPNIPWSYWLWLNVVSGNANTREMEDTFRASIERFPDYYELYRQRLYSLTPKWGGSVGAMDQFVNQYAGNAPEGSPLKLLYLQLSAYLLDAAWVECRSLAHDAAAVRSNSIDRDTVDHPMTLKSQRDRRALFGVVATVLLTLAVLGQARLEHERVMATAAENGYR
jgi:hypothetical protein